MPNPRRYHSIGNFSVMGNPHFSGWSDWSTEATSWLRSPLRTRYIHHWTATVKQSLNYCTPSSVLCQRISCLPWLPLLLASWELTTSAALWVLWSTNFDRCSWVLQVRSCKVWPSSLRCSQYPLHEQPNHVIIPFQVCQQNHNPNHCGWC